MNLSVQAGQRVAKMGPSGAGKTSLVNLLPRFHDYDSGSIFITGHELKEYDWRSLRLFMGMVSQVAFLESILIHKEIARLQAALVRSDRFEAVHYSTLSPKDAKQKVLL